MDNVSILTSSSDQTDSNSASTTTLSNSIPSSSSTSKSSEKPPSPYNSRFTYPLRYHHELSDAERWNNLAIETAIRSPFFSPPEMIPKNAKVLELACGRGLWCITAAEFKKDCHITGLDIQKIQPDLKLVGRHDLAEQITWIHSDMLKPLPFLRDHFDIVHMQHTEYAIPEKEWLNLAQEVCRILKPGGIFETFQQALIFPCPRPPPINKLPPLPPQDPKKEQMRYSARYIISPPLYNQNPLDHRLLERAHHAMLDNRQLTPGITSTIPLYLQSAFENTYVGATIHIGTPPSSFSKRTIHSEETIRALQKEGKRALLSVLPMNSRNADVEVYINLDAYRHLNHTMHIILACKEAMWDEFGTQNPRLTRDDFEFLMKNWEMDMRDRIDFRGAFGRGLKWKIPLGDESDDRKEWRQMTLRYYGYNNSLASPILDPCRTLRLFRAVKDLHSTRNSDTDIKPKYYNFIK